MFKRINDCPARNDAPRKQALHLALSLLLLLSIRYVCAQANAQTPQPGGPQPASQEVTTLEPGKPIERELAGGQKHSYQIQLSEGQYLRVEIREQGISLGVAMRLPGGETHQAFEAFGDEQPVLPMGVVAETSGLYGFDVYTTPRSSPGRYEIRVAELRPATENDRALHQARKLFWKYAELTHQSRYAQARPFLLQALEIREKVLGPDDLLVATTLEFLANNYEETGDYASAETIKLRALKVQEKVLGPDDPEVAHAYLGMGIFFKDKGDDLKAEEMFQKSLAILERTHQAEAPVAAGLLGDMGDLYYDRGDYETAGKYYERSRLVWEKLFGPDHFHLAPSYTYLGRVAYDAGDYPKAEAMFQRALALVEKALGREHTFVSKYLNDLAMVACTTGNYEKGESLYRRALAVHEQKAALGYPSVQETLLGLSRCLAARGAEAEALKYQQRASELEESSVAMNLVTGSEREKLAFLASLSSRLSRNISLHAELAPNDPAALNLAVTTILQRKGRAQDAMSASLSALRERSSADDQKLLDQLNETDSKLANLVLNGAQKASLAERQEQIGKLEEQRDGLEAEVSRRSAGFYQRSETVTLDLVRAAIPETAALVEFAVYRPFDPKAPYNQRAYNEPRYVAYVIRRQGEVQWKELGEAKAIDEAIEGLRQALRDPQRKDALERARAIDEKVMRPVRALVGGATQLLISPDGELNLIPFSALVDEQGHYLIERYAFTYLTSGRDLLRMRVERDSRSNPLIIANPSFGEPGTEQATAALATKPVAVTARDSRRRSVTDARDLSEIYFAPLDGTAQEARAIKALFPEASLLTGAQATKAAVKQVTAPRILHIATHGFFLSDTGTNPAGKTPAATRGARQGARIENPLLRSGLALAGANLRKSNNDDGILTALEASGLNLWGTKIVVLSACDTGLGEVRNGEGVYGLRRAFVLAGAESLVMSLWPASDYLTRELMTNYYKNLKQGLGRGDALRQVQLEMLRHNPHLHPFYWANFIQSGDWTKLNVK